ncbi:hypothetical protein QTN25_002880 [Entamoeba marina]
MKRGTQQSEKIKKVDETNVVVIDKEAEQEQDLILEEERNSNSISVQDEYKVEFKNKEDKTNNNIFYFDEHPKVLNFPKVIDFVEYTKLQGDDNQKQLKLKSSKKEFKFEGLQKKIIDKTIRNAFINNQQHYFKKTQRIYYHKRSSIIFKTTIRTSL